jgi:putative protease
MGVEQIAALMAAGASCFKIEGRLKGPEYVALTTRAYRDAVDRAWAGLPTALTQDARRDLTQIFSRGLTPGFLDGVYHQRLVEGRAPRHRGLSLGAIERVTRQGVFLTLNNPVKRGDGLVFDAGNPQAEEQGGKVYEIFTPQGRPVEGEADAGQPVELRFGPGVDLSRVRPGQRLWKTRDEALEARVRATYERDFTRRDPVDAVVYGREGEPLTLVLRDRAGHEVQARSSGALVAAQNQGLDADALRRYVGRMGGTPFELDGLHADLDGKLFAPPAELNALRREAVEALRLKRREAHRWTTRQDAQLPGLLGSLTRAGANAAPQLMVLCRTLEQVRAVVGLEGVEEVYLDFLELKGIQEAVRLVQRAGRKAVAAAPRVLKPDEERIWRFFLNLKADALLVRSLGLLQTLTALEGEAVPPLYGDFSLNAANALSVEFLMGRGLARLAPTHDLNAEQLCGLAGQVQADRLELIVHHHLPVFHTEHCVFCRFLSDGNDFRDCGRPCEEHQVHLRDLQGREHVVIADMGCRNTVFNAESQSGGRFLPQFLEAGYRRFRVELLEERAEEVGPLVARYQRALQGELEAPQLWRWLSEHVAQGVTLGSLLVGPSHRSMKAPAR